jgi:hypothetical protein
VRNLRIPRSSALNPGSHLFPYSNHVRHEELHQQGSHPIMFFHELTCPRAIPATKPTSVPHEDSHASEGAASYPYQSHQQLEN